MNIPEIGDIYADVNNYKVNILSIKVDTNRIKYKGEDGFIFECPLKEFNKKFTLVSSQAIDWLTDIDNLALQKNELNELIISDINREYLESVENEGLINFPKGLGKSGFTPGGASLKYEPKIKIIMDTSGSMNNQMINDAFESLDDAFKIHHPITKNQDSKTSLIIIDSLAGISESSKPKEIVFKTKKNKRKKLR